MNMQDKSIRIDDWAGSLLYIGPYDDKEVDKVLNANRCKDCDGMETECYMCDGSGYWGDFEVSWVTEELCKGNVYEYINY